MNKKDIYKTFIECLMETCNWRTEHPKLANAYVDGLLDMCIAIENTLDEINGLKDGEADDNQQR